MRPSRLTLAARLRRRRAAPEVPDVGGPATLPCICAAPLKDVAIGRDHEDVFTTVADSHSEAKRLGPLLRRGAVRAEVVSEREQKDPRADEKALSCLLHDGLSIGRWGASRRIAEAMSLVT